MHSTPVPHFFLGGGYFGIIYSQKAGPCNASPRYVTDI